MNRMWKKTSADLSEPVYGPVGKAVDWIESIPRRTKGIVLLAAGIAVCLIGPLLTGDTWNPRAPVSYNVIRSDVVLSPGEWANGQRQGRSAVPLRFVLIGGIVSIAAGAVLIATAPSGAKPTRSPEDDPRP